MLEAWNVKYRVGATGSAQSDRCLTDDDTPATHENFRRMLAITNSVTPEDIHIDAANALTSPGVA
ncbi:hypothetical protein [Amycolatopsis sp. NPDC003731]